MTAEIYQPVNLSSAPPLHGTATTPVRLHTWLPYVLTVGVDAVMFGLAGFLAPLRPREHLLYVAVGVVLQLLTRSYRSRLALHVLDDVPRLLLVSAVGTLSLLAFVDASRWTKVAPWTAALAAVLVLAGRTVVYAVQRVLRNSGHLRQRAVIVGAGSVGAELHSIFEERASYGVESLGVVDDVPFERNLPLMGRISDLNAILDGSEVDLVIVAFGPRGEQELLPVLRAVQHRDVQLAIVPRFFELGLAPDGPDVESVWGIPLYRVRRSALSQWNWPVKRSIDVLVSGVLLALVAPILASITLAVRLSSPGPILFRQQRIGQNGREIEVLKFRTMRDNDDSDVKWNVIDDPRVTPVGKWLRRLSLDELPQLWNVLRGDMSLVGPRPERPHFVDQFTQEVAGYSDRHRVPAGLTGYAQIHGLRGDTSIADRARFDNAYVEHWTPWLDVKIAIRTVTAIVRDALAAGAAAKRASSGFGAGRMDDVPEATVTEMRPVRPRIVGADESVEGPFITR